MTAATMTEGDGVPTGAPPAGDNAALLRALTNGGRVESGLLRAVGADPGSSATARAQPGGELFDMVKHARVIDIILLMAKYWGYAPAQIAAAIPHVEGMVGLSSRASAAAGAKREWRRWAGPRLGRFMWRARRTREH